MAASANADPVRESARRTFRRDGRAEDERHAVHRARPPVDPFEASAKRAAAELAWRRRARAPEDDLEADLSLNRPPAQVRHAHDVAPWPGRARPVRHRLQGRVERRGGRDSCRWRGARIEANRRGNHQDGEQMRRERNDGGPILRHATLPPNRDTP